MVLYRCGEHRVVAIPDSEIVVWGNDRSYIQYEVRLSGTNQAGNPPNLSEHIEIAPGTPVGAKVRQRQVIVKAYQY
jgi:hypothetical protein